MSLVGKFEFLHKKCLLLKNFGALVIVPLVSHMWKIIGNLGVFDPRLCTLDGVAPFSNSFLKIVLFCKVKMFKKRVYCSFSPNNQIYD